MTAARNLRIHITGIVQGVGFRPFVYGLATGLALAGWVRNTSAGVDIALDGDTQALEKFLLALKTDLPPLARIDHLDVTWGSPGGFKGFEIIHSEPIAGAFLPVSPDVSTCPDCLQELFDPQDRRFRYPFINCTNCGPRFTIITDIPYDRPNTTMAPFAMCPDCAAEYRDPRDRRYHAQPVACPQCGPKIWLETDATTRGKYPEGQPALQQARALLVNGRILAVKGLGGFHLACDATNVKAVNELRRRKLRVDKPFALMMPDMATVEAHCFVNDVERALLETHARPIVLLYRKPVSTIVHQVAPGQETLGVMLPYTPLHTLLFSDEVASREPEGSVADGLRPLTALVMTSGNLSEEPIATSNEEARQRLAPLADAFLMHDREIRTRCDDSVVRVIFEPPALANKKIAALVHTLENESGPASIYPLRRSRGYAPDPILLPFDVLQLLATGAELKNTFCLTRKQYAFLSHHIGDMENYETLRSFEDGIEHFERLFRIKPQALAYDLHPNYLATRYAQERAEREGLPAFGVQHHHAHIAACMADHGLVGERPVIGVAFDGTGYGEDGAIWGGEFLLADYHGYRRVCHLEYIRLPGGDLAVREPWRLALAWLDLADVDWEQHLNPVRAAGKRSTVLNVLRKQLEMGLNSPQTSSMGRLFDAVSALAGVRQKVNYEAQAAIELEAQVDPSETGMYEFGITENTLTAVPVIQSIVKDVRLKVSTPVIAARFHNGLSEAVLRVCQKIRRDSGALEVALSGGVWQNIALLQRSLALLRADNFKVFVHRQVPTNDGGIALGQAVVAIHTLQGGG